MFNNTAKRAPGARRVAIFGAALVAATAIIVAVSGGALADRASAATAARSSESAQFARTTAMDATIKAEEGRVDLEAKAADANLAALQRAADAKVKADRAAAAAVAAAAAARPTLNVWTSGFQAQINACRGGVDVTAHYGTRTVAEHWQCGGRSFPTAAGTIVTFTGLDAGTYKVVGMVAVLNAYTARTTQIPRGYAMLLQTCRNGDSHTTEFIALDKLS